MNKKKKIVMIGVVLFFVFSITAFGVDFDDNIMRNDHDALLIGEIISIDEREVVIQAVDYIVSAYSLNEGAAEQQLRPEAIRIIRDEQIGDFHVGDHVLASLNQNDGDPSDLFVIAWGIYRIDLVDELDWQVWYVETDDMLRSIVLSDFVNQEGRYTYSMREDGTIVRHQEDVEIVIYDPDPSTEIQPREGDDEAQPDDDGEVDRPEELSNTPMLITIGITSAVLVAVIIWFATRNLRANK